MKRYIFLGISTFLLALSIVLLGINPFKELYNEGYLINVIIIFVLILVLTIAFLILFNTNMKNQNSRLKERLKTWSQISYRVDQVGDEAFNELPIGMIAFDDVFDISWLNPFANKIFSQSVLHKSVLEASDELYELIDKDIESGIVKINEKHYQVTYKKNFNFFYLFDVSEHENLKVSYQENIQTLGILILDNLDESFASLDMSEQSSIKGQYLSAIHDWVVKYKGYLKPVADDRLLMFISRKELRQMIEDKFDILDTIRMTSVENGLKITLSMGIVSWDINYEELGLYAQNAIDLAEKRGGDQVVVNIQNEKIAYFGAKSDALTKSSRVTSRINAQSIKDLIKDSDQVFIMGHDQTDLDSFGSSIAVYHMASVDKKSHIIFDYEKIDNTVKRIYHNLENDNEDILNGLISTPTALKLITDKSLLIIVDTQSPKMVMSPDVLAAIKNLIVIDHHRISNEGFEAQFSVVEASASSTIELLMDIIGFYEEGIKFLPVEASIMYGGLVVDTNHFTIRTSSRTFEVAHKLKEFGADTALVKTWLRRDLNQTILVNKLLANIEIYLERFAFILSDELIEDRILIALAAEQAINIHGIDAAFVITQTTPNNIGVSARSTNKVNVQLAMEVLGGGGHLNSAAAQINNKSVNEVYKELKAYLDIEYGTEGERMKVILLEDIKGKGKKDDVVDLANGYAQFLLNSKKAVVADDDNLLKLAAKQQEVIDSQKRHLDMMNKVKGEIDNKQITLPIQVGKDGKLFGSITTKQIAENFEKEHGIAIDRKKLELFSDINSAGIYAVTVHLHKDIKAQFEVIIVEEN